MISTEKWVPADGLVLEPNALKAAKVEQGCLALTAGPGAGKTEMLAQRADFLLRTGVCRYPKRILAISFKVDASKNLKERVQKRCGFDLGARFDSYTFHGFAKRIIDRFRPILKGLDALDANYSIGDNRISRTQITFSDLVPLAVQILQQSEIARNAIRQTYSDVFLDEFQDCTNEQYKLIQSAFLGTPIRLTAVGDTKQKIMGWAGAMEGIFQTFSIDFIADKLNLYRNFRSKPKLLRMQNEIIAVLDPESVMSDDLLVGEEGEIVIKSFQDSHEEANYITNLIKDWIENENIPLNQIAVLVSKQIDLYAKNLMDALEDRGIPFRNEQALQDITTEPLARLIVDYMFCLYGKREPKAWERIINQLVPFNYDEDELNTRGAFSEFLMNQKKSLNSESPYFQWWNKVKTFLQHIGKEIITSLSPDYESPERLNEVIIETKKRIDELLLIEPELSKTLHRFTDDHAVRILTIHKSKGLEFHSVVIMAVETEIFFGKPDEDRCAFFVGVSRAKQRLILTHTNFRERPEGAGRWNANRTVHVEFCGYATQS
jgi:superfamily I DNA/RNA helicase